MAALSHAESRCLYSWWWDSHISPKNSKWLQENLTDMDMKVKTMIKLLEEDADSFARRAEMYYKKRPELMKLVEEFYRAYRALAERYDHATGALRQAHRTMAEAFPNQIPFSLNDDSPSGSSSTEGEPHTPERPPPICEFFEPDELQKDDLGRSSHFRAIKRNGAFSEENDALTSKKGLKQLNEMFASGEGTGHPKFAEGRVRKGLNFQDDEGKVSEHNAPNGSRDIQKQELGEKEDAYDKIKSLQEEISQISSENQNLKMQVKSENEHAGKAETEVQRLQEALSRLEAENEAILLKYQQSLEKISNLETQISCIKEDYRKLGDDMFIKAARLDSADEKCLLLEKENQALRLEGGALAQKTNEQQQKIQQKHDEMEKLKNSLQHEHMRYMQAEAVLQSLEKLHSESLEKLRISALGIQSGVELLKDVKLRKRDLEEGIQQAKDVNSNLNKELKRKQEESDKLSISIQDEHLLSVQAKEALQSLEKLHSQSQEEIKILMLNVQRRVEMLKDMELKKQGLEEEVQQIKEENKHLAEHNLSFALMIKNLQYEILSLKETQKKLEDEVGLRVDASKTLQQEIYHFKEEINDLNQKHQCVVDQMGAVGLNKESFQASVKELQDGNLQLKEICKKHEDEKMLLLEKLKNMETMAEKNAILDISLSDANTEIEGLGEKIKALEELCETLHGRNSALISENGALIFQLETVTQNTERLSENNVFLENTLSDANIELEGLRGKLESLEQSCQSFYTENSNLQAEKNTLISQVESISTSLENQKKKYAELEEKLMYLEREKESTLVLVSELQNLLKLAKQEHENYIQSSKTQLAALEGRATHLQEEGHRMDEEFKEEQHRLLEAQIEIFILQRSLCGLIETNSSLARESQKHLKASICAEKLISELQQENLHGKKRVESLSEHNMKLREGIQMALKSLKINKDYGDSEGTEGHWQLIFGKIREIQDSIMDAQDENQNLMFENLVNITLLQQLGLDAADLKSEIRELKQEYKARNEGLIVLQKEKYDLLQMNGQLRQDVHVGCLREDKLKAEIEILDQRLLETQEANWSSQNEVCKLLEENRSLSDKILNLREEVHMLEEASSSLFTEAMTLCCLSVIFEQSAAETVMDLKRLGDDLGSLHRVNIDLEKKVREMVEKIGVMEAENLLLKGSAVKLEEWKSHLVVLEYDLSMARNVNEELNRQIEQLDHLIDAKENSLIQRDLQLAEVNQKFKATENENVILHNDFAAIRMELDEATSAKEDLERDIFMLMEGDRQKSKEIGHIHEANMMLSSELHNFQNENVELRNSKEHLTSKSMYEAKCYEEEAAAFCNDIHISTVRADIFEEKVLELIGECESLEINAIVQRKVLEEEISSRNKYNGELDQKLDRLEEENKGLKANLSTYLPLVLSLCDSFASLENCTLSLIKHRVADNQEAKDDLLQHVKSSEQPFEDPPITAPAGILELQKLQAKIDTLQRVVQSENLLMLESFDGNAKPGASKGEGEELKPERSSDQVEAQTSKDHAIIMQLEEEGERPGEGLEQQQDSAENPEGKYRMMVKDIQLDQVSSSSQYEVGRSACGTDRIEHAETDDRMLKLWETTERNCGNQMQKAPSVGTEDDTEYSKIEAMGEEKSEYPSSELVAEKELGVDKLEVSKEFKGSHQEWNKRVLERLASDAQSLSVLQTVVQELKKKMESSEKSDHPASLNYINMKGQLEEAEEAILQLVDLNSKLTQKVEEYSKSYDGEVGEQEANGNRRKISNSARRGSEKIGRLELELQKIRYLVLKLEEEQKNGSKAVRGRRRVLLRDYLYGRRESYRRGHFCGCFQTNIRGE